MPLQRSVWFRYGVTVAAVALTFALRLALRPILGDAYPVLTFFPAIMVAGWIGGLGPGVFATLLAAVCALFLLAPSGSPGVDRPQDWVGLSLFTLTGLFMSWLNQTRAEATRQAQETARVLEESRALLQTAYEREKRIAETLQRSLLMAPAADSFDGLRVESFYEPARDEALVGGDFFDAFALSGNKVALVVGDVSGKGLAAAAHTAEIKYALRTILREDPHPATALMRLNNVICEAQELEKHDYGRFVTIALAVVNPETGDGSLSTAGSEPPLLVRRPPDAGAEPVCEFLEDAPGLPLCVEGKFAYAVAPLHLDPADTLLLLTDGITEARRGREFLGVDGLAALARDGARRPALRDMGSVIIDGARAFAGGRLQDDACLLLARRV